MFFNLWTLLEKKRAVNGPSLQNKNGDLAKQKTDGKQDGKEIYKVTH